MKCIQIYKPHRKAGDTTGIHRVTNEEAELKVQAGVARYIPKEMWKKKVRDV